MPKQTLRKKLILSSLQVSLCTLFAACVVFVWTSFRDSREQELRRVSTAVRVVAQSASAVVAFSDKDAAEELLSAFEALPLIRTAQLWSETHEELATFKRDQAIEITPIQWQSRDPPQETIETRSALIEISIPILQSSEVMGYLTVSADSTRYSQLLQGSALAALLVFCIGAVASLFLGALAAGRLVRPIQALASSMEEVSMTKNYSKRLVSSQGDEIGALFGRFNEMLEQVRSRDATLVEYQQTLEQRVHERTQALDRERQQLLDLIKNAPIAIAMLDNDLRYIAHSKKWCDDYGLGNQHIEGRTHYEVFPDIPERWKTVHRSVLKGVPEHASEDVFERADGNRIFLRWAVHPWYHPDGTQGGVVMVTDRIDDLVAAREAALNTAKMRSEFLTNMSHELRTPLNGILGYTDLLLDDEQLSVTERGYIETIRSSGQVLLTLITDILDYSKLEQKKVTIEISRFKLSDVIRTASQVFGGQAERKGITLEASTALSDLMVRGDQLRLQQVLMNLIGNAVKFTSKGYVKTGLYSVACIDGALDATFVVQDTGIGIPKSKQTHIFEAFSQADGSTTRRYGGTGLGLSISMELVRLMGGRIWVESDEGIGSSFYFTVRLEQDEESKEIITAPIPSQNALSSTDGKKNYPVLIAEDNPMNQKLVATILQKAGYEVMIVNNGKEAVEAYERMHFALVLMDLQMPVMNGLDAIQEIRKRETGQQNRVPIVALTAHAFSEHREQCLEAGVNDYLTKPLNRNLLLETIQRLVAADPVKGELTLPG